MYVWCKCFYISNNTVCDRTKGYTVWIAHSSNGNNIILALLWWIKKKNVYTPYWANTFLITIYFQFILFFFCFKICFLDKPITTEATTLSVILNTTSVILDTTPANESRVDSNNDCLDCANDIELKVPITGKSVV